MEIQKSDIVRSCAGRDKGKLLFVLNVDGAYLFLADGKGRRLENPKRKKAMHVQFFAKSGGRTAEKLRSGDKVSNSELRRALAAVAAEPTGESGGV